MPLESLNIQNSAVTARGYDSDTFRMAMLLYCCCGFRKSEVQNLKVGERHKIYMFYFLI